MYEVVTNIELKPCPVCGQHRVSMYKDHPAGFYFFVRCKICGIKTQFEHTEEEAAKRWNKRK